MNNRRWMILFIIGVPFVILMVGWLSPVRPDVVSSATRASVPQPNLDVIVVFDTSGSMEYETTCFGCWVEKPEFRDGYGIRPDEVLANRFPRNGDYNPLRFEDPLSPTISHDVFWGGDPDDFGNPNAARPVICKLSIRPSIIKLITTR